MEEDVKRNRALRAALVEIHNALAALGKASAALKKASSACKGYREKDMIGSYVLDVQKTICFLNKDHEAWMKEADEIQLGIINRKEGENDR